MEDLAGLVVKQLRLNDGPDPFVLVHTSRDQRAALVATAERLNNHRSLTIDVRIYPPHLWRTAVRLTRKPPPLLMARCHPRTWASVPVCRHRCVGTGLVRTRSRRH